MHISEGVLSAPVVLAGWALAATGVALGLRKLDYEHIMGVAIVSAAFFVASLIHVPLGPASVHLVLNGLMGALLGPAAFPAILVALMLQAMLFQYGGLVILGVNTFNMALPAVLCFYVFRPWLRRGGAWRSSGAFLCGALAVLLSGLLTAGALVLSGEAFQVTAQVILAAHLPVMAVEGLLTLLAVGFLAKARPEMLATTLGK
jgi:cobalt/nickel transport system permease protein